MSAEKKKPNKDSQEGKNSPEQLYSGKGHLNDINSYLPILKEAGENDIDKTVLALMKREVPNAIDQLESDQPQEGDEKHQHDIKQNNSMPNTSSVSQASTLRTPTRDKNAVCKLDRTSSRESHTAIQCIRAQEVAEGMNNEQQCTRWEIIAQVDNNLTMDVLANDTRTLDGDDAAHHNGTRTPRMELSGSDPVTAISPVPQTEEQSVSSIATVDPHREECSEVDDNMCKTQTDLQPCSECELSNNYDETCNRKEDSRLWPVQSEQNSDDIPPPAFVSPQQHTDTGVYASLCGPDKNLVDSQPISSPLKQQPTSTDYQGENPLQNLSDLPPHSLQQLCDTYRVKDDPPQCCVDDNSIDLLSRGVISSPEQSDADDWREGPSQLHSHDSFISPLPDCVVVPPQTTQQHLAVDDGKGNPLKQLLSVQASLSDDPPKWDTVQLLLNENAIDNHSPCTVVSSHQQSAADDQKEGSSHLLSDEHSVTKPSPAVASISSQEQLHQGDQPVQHQSNQDAIDLSLCSSISSQQQLDADCDSPLLSEGKSHINSVASTEQSCPVGQKESTSDTSGHLPDIVTSSHCDTYRGPPQCCMDKNFLPRVAVSSQKQSDADDWREGPSQLHSHDSFISPLPDCVVAPVQTTQQRLAVDDGKGNPLKQLLSVQASLSDDPPEGDKVQLLSNENTIDNHSPCTMISSHQQSGADDRREGSSQHLLSSEHKPSPAISSQEQLHQGDQPVQHQSNQGTEEMALHQGDQPVQHQSNQDTEEMVLHQGDQPVQHQSNQDTEEMALHQGDQPVQHQSNQDTIDLSLCSTISLQQQLDIDGGSPLLSAQQSCPIGQKESTSDTNGHLPDTATSPPIDLLPLQKQSDVNDQREGPSQLLHPGDSSACISPSPHCVVAPAQTTQQHLAADNGKGNPLKQLLSIQASLSDDPPEGDTVQLLSNENTIDNHSPCTVISSHQQSGADDRREGSSQHLFSSENKPSPAIPSQEQLHQGDQPVQHQSNQDTEEMALHQGDQPVQHQSNQDTIDLSLCSAISSQQQLDVDGSSPLLSEGKSHVNSVASAQQPCPVGQKESTSDTSGHLPDTATSPQPSGNGRHKDLALLPQPAHLKVVIRRQKRNLKHRKRRHCSGRVKRSKPHRKRPHSSHTSLRCYHKQGSPHPQPIKDKVPKPTTCDRNDNSAPTNKGNTDTEKPGYRSSKQGSSFLNQPNNTQEASSPGGSSNDGGGDEDEDKDPYSGGRSFHSHPNWILLLLIVLLILCFCFPRPEEPSSHTDTESVCSTVHLHTTALDLKSSHFLNSSLDDHTPALFRGPLFSKPRRNGGEESASSNTFPEGCSTDHLVSEEETPRDMCQGEELAGLQKLHLKRRRRERPHTTPLGSPRPQLDLNVSEPLVMSISEPKLFTYPSPEENRQETHDYITSRGECTCTHSCDSVDKHMIFQSNCVFKASRLSSNTNVRHILTDVDIHQHQQTPPLLSVPNVSNAADSSSTTTGQEQEEDVEQQQQEDDDPPSQFRGPGTAYKKFPDRSEGHTLDSGVGTNSQTQNQVPTAHQILPVAATKIDTSWRTSIKKDEIVYLTPSTDNTVGGHRSNFQVVPSVEEQTPRSPNYRARDELVVTEQKDNEPADAISLQPVEPLLECREYMSLLLEPSMRVFPYPSPSDESVLNLFQDIPENNLCVFVSGSTLYANRRPSFPVTCSILTDDTIGQSQRYRRLLYFNTKV